MRTRQSHEGRLGIIKHKRACTKQTDKHAIMATEKGNTTEAVVQEVAKIARVAVQAMVMASTDNNQRAQIIGPK